MAMVMDYVGHEDLRTLMDKEDSLAIWYQGYIIYMKGECVIEPLTQKIYWCYAIVHSLTVNDMTLS